MHVYTTNGSVKEPGRSALAYGVDAGEADVVIAGVGQVQTRNVQFTFQI